MRIVIDGMGGDHAPDEIIKGVLASAAAHPDVDHLVTGPTSTLGQAFAANGSAPNIEIVDAPELIEMGEEPGKAVRSKPESSIVKGARMVKDGEADAFLSAGNTGATMAAALLQYGRISGIKRPAIATMMPAAAGPFMLLDAGATADCKPENLVQFAQMGAIYSRLVLGKEAPRVGLLNIGGEEEKGSVLYKEAHQLLKGAPVDFIGNVEGRNIFDNAADVVICDGFTGNVVLKVVEGVGENTLNFLKNGITSSLRAKAGGLLLKPVLKSFKRATDPDEIGGAPLLGIDGVCIIAHGGSSAKAIANACDVAIRTVRTDVIGEIANELHNGVKTDG